MVTPATIGWNIVSSSCRPRKYHGAFDGFGVWLMLASCEQRGVDEDREDERERQADERGDELGRRAGAARCAPCRPGTALTSWIEPALDDGQQALGVTARAGADRDAGAASAVAWTTDATRSGDGDGAATGGRRRRAAPAFGLGGPGALEQVGGDARLLGGWRGGRAARPAGSAAAGGRRRPAASSARLVAGRLRPASGGVRGSRSWQPSLLGHSGPEMPPSLRTRQKWIAMKMTMTNGSNRTCSTYQRSSVSGPISAPPSSTKRTC